MRRFSYLKFSRYRVSCFILCYWTWSKWGVMLKIQLNKASFVLPYYLSFYFGEWPGNWVRSNFAKKWLWILNGALMYSYYNAYSKHYGGKKKEFNFFFFLKDLNFRVTYIKSKMESLKLNNDNSYTWMEISQGVTFFVFIKHQKVNLILVLLLNKN